ncbi:MAG: hypothetical protein OEQ12_06325 [Nitrosopumilus sp.]|nr:hypothetical protein [Nitrosopumilus sp.]
MVGVSLSMWGASWDITSHLLRTPETFFTPSHIVLYAGVGISMVSALIGLTLILVKKEVRGKSFVFGTKLIIIGALMQITAGPGDFYWHELFGIDGLLSPTHLTLAVGIIITTIGSIVGFARVYFEMNRENNFLKMILPIAFGIFWFSIMWLIFFFVLPISEGDTHNFNPNPYVAIVLGVTLLPFSFSLIFWFTSKSVNRFGAASAAALVFLTMNITANIITSEKLFFYLPWFAAPLVSAVLADYILNSKTKIEFLQIHSNKISGFILGSMFFMFCFPMLAMTFLDFYVFNDVFSYDVIHSSQNTITSIWLMTIIPGAIFGMIGTIFAQKKFAHLM